MRAHPAAWRPPRPARGSGWSPAAGAGTPLAAPAGGTPVPYVAGTPELAGIPRAINSSASIGSGACSSPQPNPIEALAVEYRDAH
eukprot:COSAG02_NODE_2230_length_9425_cov_5.740039_4_plen_85_part_00